MGNKPDRSRKMQQPYNQMVEDAIAALKDRPGSTQADIFNYLEAKYEGRISPKNKQNLQTVIRSVIQTKKRLRTGMGRPSARKFGGRGGTRLKAKNGVRRNKFGGRGLPRGRVRGMTTLQGRAGPSKGLKIMATSLKTPKMGKSKLGHMPKSAKGAGHSQLLRRMKRGRGGKLLLRPARRTTSEGSMCLPRMNGRMRRN